MITTTIEEKKEFPSMHVTVTRVNGVLQSVFISAPTPLLYSNGMYVYQELGRAVQDLRSVANVLEALDRE